MLLQLAPHWQVISSRRPDSEDILVNPDWEEPENAKENDGDGVLAILPSNYQLDLILVTNWPIGFFFRI